MEKRRLCKPMKNKGNNCVTLYVGETTTTQSSQTGCGNSCGWGCWGETVGSGCGKNCGGHCK